jgi:hypothetical protein
MRFRTRWLGYGPDDDTQQSYASLKNNLVFHKYCREQNLTKLIRMPSKTLTIPEF